MTHQELESIVKTLAQDHFDLEVTSKALPGEFDLNCYVKDKAGKEYVMKIAHSFRDRSLLDLENQAMIHLANKETGLALPQLIPNRDGQEITEIKWKDGSTRLLRLLSWVPGTVFAKINPHPDSLLESLGSACGNLCKGLQDFAHPAAEREWNWVPERVQWAEENIAAFPTEEEREIVEYFLKMHQEISVPLLPGLRKSINHNDANDYNVMVKEVSAMPMVSGMIDFGDVMLTHTVADLAIAIAYAAMDKPDPLAAAALVVRGFHKTFPLEEDELEVLFPFVCARLVLSVTHSALNKQDRPENEYLLVSERPAWDLLRKLRSISPAFAHFTFRKAAGLAAVPHSPKFMEWVKSKTHSFHPLILPAPTTHASLEMDLSIGSLALGNAENYLNDQRLNRRIQRMLEDADAEIGWGGYDEVRPFYITDAYQTEGNHGPQWRSVHLGQDFWIKESETLVYAPLKGKVHSFADNNKARDYGPTIVLVHEEAGMTFFTLYGHLSRASLREINIGQEIKAGQQIGSIGEYEENGNWPPHLHFQIILDMLGEKGDFPGAAFFNEKETWLDICPNPSLITGMESTMVAEKSPQSLIDARHTMLGKGMSISYKEPLKMLRGVGQYLIDHTGRRYLDTVNNVAHVGHEHPDVVRVAQQQNAVLNTNSRYLHDNIVEYAAALLDKFPPELCVVHFVNSGSEANELAMRMARTLTQQNDLIVLEGGYHGNTGATIEISEYKFNRKGGKGAADHIHVAPMPDTFRGQFRENEPAPGARYAAFIEQLCGDIQGKGKGVAAFIHESILSCGGQIVLPEGYLKASYAAIRKAGGVCIADEVQVGFGRVGDTFWGFELQEVVPDIVTLGKPIGNGHPLGAVVTTRKVADAFANGMEYFNTFGGNPVSCAIGLEVLRVIREEGLQKNAAKSGELLTTGLRELQQEFPLIGEVRGHGLFLGFELVTDLETRLPAAEKAAYFSNRMRELSILTSRDGPDENVIKIKPPICFDAENVSFFLEMTRKVMKEMK